MELATKGRCCCSLALETGSGVPRAIERKPYVGGLVLGYARSGARALRQCGATDASEKLAPVPAGWDVLFEAATAERLLGLAFSRHAFANHCVIDLQAAFWLQGLCIATKDEF